MSLERIQGQLTQRRGIDPASLSRVGLEASLRRRMAALSIPSEAHYADRLVVDPVEFERLVAAVLVHETSFFRYPASFDLLAREAVARLRENSRATFRVACVATSTGEEPASVVMALLEAGLLPGQFHVDASDLSARAIEYAQAGRYRRRGVERLSGEIRRRWFEAEGEHYRLRRSIRRHIRYSQENALGPAFGKPAVPYDAVFCRNLLIYLVPEARRGLLGVLENMLRPEGLLFLGHAEVTAARAQGLVIEPPSEAFACRRAARPVEPALAEPRPAPSRTTPTRRRPPPSRAVVTRPSAEDALAEASALADAGKLDEARSALVAAIAQGPACADHYHLLALVESARGNDDACEDALRRALYLEPRHYPSLMQLALLHETRGERGRAQRLRAKAARVKGGDDGR